MWGRVKRGVGDGGDGGDRRERASAKGKRRSSGVCIRIVCVVDGNVR